MINIRDLVKVQVSPVELLVSGIFNRSSFVFTAQIYRILVNTTQYSTPFQHGYRL